MSNTDTCRYRAAFALGKIKPTDPEIHKALAKALAKALGDSD
jgi:HEAT repeat protein